MFILLISLILKFYTLFRVNFLYWGVIFPSIRVNLSRVTLISNTLINTSVNFLQQTISDHTRDAQNVCAVTKGGSVLNLGCQLTSGSVTKGSKPKFGTLFFTIF